jgi:hypothetical protein
VKTKLSTLRYNLNNWSRHFYKPSRLVLVCGNIPMEKNEPFCYSGSLRDIHIYALTNCTYTTNTFHCSWLVNGERGKNHAERLHQADISVVKRHSSDAESVVCHMRRI